MSWIRDGFISLVAGLLVCVIGDKLKFTRSDYQFISALLALFLIVHYVA